MKKLLTLCLTVFLCVSALPLSTFAATEETQISSDIAVQGLRDIRSLQVHDVTHQFVTTYPEEDVTILAECEDTEIAAIEVDGHTIQITGKQAGETRVHVYTEDKEYVESFLVQVINPIYENSSHQEYNINQNDWAFQLEKNMQNVPAKQEVPAIDQSWKNVQVPHCWNAMDGADGNNDYHKGRGWYISDFVFDAESFRDKDVFLEIQGASKVSEVYINGQYIGTHEGGYSNFRFEIDEEIQLEEHNQIAICVDNRVNNLMPLSGDFTVFGGLYRNVNLIAVDQAHFDLNDHGSEGVLLSQQGTQDINKDSTIEDVYKDGAKLYVDAQVVTKKDQAYRVKTEVYDADWQLVKQQEQVLQGNGKKQQITDTLTIANPHIWNGVIDPYLYNVKVMLYDEQDALKDVVYKKIGFRFYYVDNDEGFFLNGKSYPLRGVNKHQDRFEKGYAISQKDQEEDMAMIADIGANALRLAHYQHDEYAYALADEYGICTWAEIPLVNGMVASASFTNNAKDNLEELIKQNISHASIVVWGIHNEQWPNNGGKINTLLRDLYDLSHVLDDSRYVSVATAQSESAALSWQSDVSAWNKYFGLYESQDVRYFGTWLDQVKTYARTHDTIGVLDESTGEMISVPVNGNIGMSEYGVGSNIEYHEENPGYRVGTSFNAYQSEEFQSQWHEIYYKAIEERDWLWGTFVWNMFEFGSDARSEAGRKGVNNKGLVSYDRTTKKDVYYFYRANWSKEATLHITSKRFYERFQDQIKAKIYANMDEVELFVNDTSLGVVKASDTSQQMFLWNVKLQHGENKVVAVGKKDGKTYVDQTTWTRALSDEIVCTSNVYNLTYVNDENSTVSGVHAGTNVKEFMQNISLRDGTQVAFYGIDKETMLEENAILANDMWVKVSSESGNKSIWYRLISEPISKGKRVEVDYESTSEPKANLVDGNIDTAWNSGKTLSSISPQNAIIDLGQNYYIYDTNILWWDHATSHRTFTYSVYISNDQTNWIKVIDNKNSSDQSNGATWSNQNFTPMYARYVRIEGLKATSSVASMYIREAQVHGFALTSDIYRVDHERKIIQGAIGEEVVALKKHLLVNGNFDTAMICDANGNLIEEGTIREDMSYIVEVNGHKVIYRFATSGQNITAISQGKPVVALEGVDADGLIKPNEDVLEGENDEAHGKNYAPAHYINDGDTTTRWSGAMNAKHDKAIYPAKILFDLQNSYDLNYLDLMFYGGSVPYDEQKVNRYYTYKIYASNQQADLMQASIDSSFMIVDGSNNVMQKQSHVQRDLKACNARYVLLVVDGKNTSFDYHAPSVWELKMEGYTLSSSVYTIDKEASRIQNVTPVNVETFLSNLNLDGNYQVALCDEDKILDMQDMLYAGVTLEIRNLHGEVCANYQIAYAKQDIQIPLSQNKKATALMSEAAVDGKIVPNEDVEKGFIAKHINDGSLDTRWSGVMNADRTTSYYPASVHLQLSDENDTNDWYYLTGVSIDWFNSATKRSYQYELHALNPVGIAGGFDLDQNANTQQDHSEYWLQDKRAQIKDMTLKVTGSSAAQAFIPAVVKEIKVYGWRLGSSIVDESNASVRLENNHMKTAELIARLQPRGNCNVIIRDKHGVEKAQDAIVNAGDYIDVQDSRDQHFIYTIKQAQVDVSKLQALIAKCSQLQASNYTSDTWQAMMQVCEDAKALLNATPSQHAIDEMFARLQTAMDQLVFDNAFMKELLFATLEKMEALKKDAKYTILAPSIQVMMEQTYDQAKLVYNDASASNAECMHAWLSLANALHYADFTADKTALKVTIDICEALHPEDYSAGYEALEIALQNAWDVYQDENALDVRIQNANTALLQAYHALVKNNDTAKATLQTLVNTFDAFINSDAHKYCDNGAWKTFVKALDAAKGALANTEATVNEIHMAILTLTSAYENIRLLPDEEVLHALAAFITRLASVDLRNYQTELVARFMMAASQARMMVQEPNTYDPAMLREIADINAIFDDTTNYQVENVISSVDMDETLKHRAQVASATTTHETPKTADTTNCLTLAVLALLSIVTCIVMRKQKQEY